ncbi:MAG TPA: recombinase family protein [Bryobacteraceae bacterium]|nr:recombinase family protein [Bryobacteraceae bacterium]
MEEYTRDVVQGTLTFEYFQERVKAGWTPIAVEWARPSNSTQTKSRRDTIEPPYGFQIAADCKRLEPNPQEVEVLQTMLEEIVQDHRFTQIAEALNKRSLRTREGRKWSPTAVFDLLPALIDAGPSLTKSEAWARRRPAMSHTLPA